jgi:hypothetical protein
MTETDGVLSCETLEVYYNEEGGTLAVYYNEDGVLKVGRGGVCWFADFWNPIGGAILRWL